MGKKKKGDAEFNRAFFVLSLLTKRWNGLLRCSSPTQPKSNFLVYGLARATTLSLSLSLSLSRVVPSQFRVRFSQLDDVSYVYCLGGVQIMVTFSL